MDIVSERLRAVQSEESGQTEMSGADLYDSAGLVVKVRNSMGKENGLTLIEIMLVILLIGIIGTVLVKGLMAQGDNAKAKINVTKMEKLKQALSLFKAEYGRYPSDLRGLVKKPSELNNSGKLFTKLAEEEDLVDVFSNPYIYKPQNDNRSFSLTTLGADGQAGGEDANQDVTITP